MTPKVWDKVARRMRSKSDMRSAESQRCSDELLGERGAMPKPATIRGRPLLKSQISNPEFKSMGRASGQSSTSLESLHIAQGKSSPQCILYRHSTLSDLVPRQSTVKGPRQEKYILAKPRLSPMEYARMHLVEKSLSSREGRSCELPAPKKLWFWTPRWEKFLILPALPPNIKRQADLKPVVPSTPVEPPESVNDGKVPNPIPPDSGCPRLSLNLGHMTSLFPSLIDLSFLDRSTDSSPKQFPDNDGRFQAQQNRNSVSSREGRSVTPNLFTKNPPLSLDELDTPHQTSAHRKLRSVGIPLSTGVVQIGVEFPGFHTVIPGFQTPEKELGQPQSSFQEPPTATDSPDDQSHEALSLYSQDSGETVVASDRDSQVLSLSPSTPKGPTAARGAGTRRHIRENSSGVTNFEYSPTSNTSDDVSTTFAHFPLGREHPCRSVFVRGVVTSSGRHLDPEDVYQPQLGTAESPGSMIAELQPAPLRLRRQPSLISDTEDRFLSSQGVSTIDPGGQVGRVEDDEYNRSAATEVKPPILLRTTIKINSNPSHQSDPTSFSIAPKDTSGFTTRHDRRHYLPRKARHSPTLPDYEPSHDSPGGPDNYFIETTAEHIHHN